MKKLFAILLCGVFVCLGGVLTTEESYATHWADQYLNNLVSEGIMRGDDDGNLFPDNSITRAEFVAMMNRAFGYDEKGKMNFNDVSEEAWYYDDIAIAYNQGYFNGVYADTAGPDTPLKREQAVAMLCRALKIEGVDQADFTFTDDKEFSYWSKSYINATTQKQILSGYPDNTFRPAEYMKRGEMAKVLSEVAGEIIKDEGSNYIGYANGNVSVVQSGASLRNTTVPGDLYITAGTGTGYTQLENVTVGGDLIISGTGNSEKGDISVVLEDCDINRLIIDSADSNIMSVRAEGSSTISDTVVKSNAYLEEDGSKRSSAFRNVELKGLKATKLSLSGDFEEVIVRNPDNKLSLDKGSIETLTIDEDATKGVVFLEKNTTVESIFCDTATTVTGTGEIENVIINSNGSNISVLPEHIYIRPGVTATINGKVMTSLEAEANSADPEFIEDYPKYDELAATAVTLYAKTNKPGKVYWAVKNVDLVSSGMSYDEVKKPESKSVVKSGSVNVMTEKEVTIKVSGLTSGVNYEYYMVFEDLKEEHTKVNSDEFTTVDKVIPKFLNSTPKITASNETSFTVTAIPSKDVTLYWAVLPTKSVPPTVETLAKQKVSGAIIKGSVAGCLMNETKEILMEGTDEIGLAEKVTYDIYIVAEDESGNLSKLTKIVGTTLDATDPEFISGYPWAEPSAVTSLKVRYMTNEDGTLYWSAYAFDTVFPPVDEADTLTGSALKTAQVRAITTGQKAVKSGKTNVTMDKEGLLTISGLAKQTPYDVYFVIMDKAGNYSEVKSLKGLKTVDNAAPTATMEFEKVVGGNPTVDSDITIEFNEIAYFDSSDGSDIRLINLPADQKESILESMFVLHDLLTTKQPNVITDVNYGDVTIGENDGKTIVTFSQSCFDNGNGLNSGGTYQFEMNDIVDSEGNAINQKTLLSSFKIVPPQVYVSRYNGGNLDIDELGFTISPTSDINSDKRFDIIIQTDQQIKFDLYKGTSTDSLNTKEIIIEAGKARSLTSLIGASTYDEFVDLQEADYKIKVLTLNGISKQSSWDGTLNIQVMAVIGESSDLYNLSQAINDKDNPLTIVSNDADTLVVSNPTIFKTTKVYSDTSQPVLVDGIDFEPFDTAVNVTAMADKTAELYYVVVPKANMVGKSEPTVDQVLAGLPSYLDSKTGSLSLTNGNTQYSKKITELIPETEYWFYHVLKGKSPENLVVVTDAAFETEPIITPEFTDALGPSGSADAKTAEMQGILNTDATVYWIMCPGGKYAEDYFEDIVSQIIKPNNEDSTIVDSGNLSVDKDTQFTFTCENMDPTKTYDVFAVAVSDYGKVTSLVNVYPGLRCRDTLPPTIIGSPTTTIHEVNTVSSGSITINKYNGYIAVRFSEPLYYKNSLSGSEMAPLTAELVETADSTLSVLSYDRANITLTVEGRETDDADSDGLYPITGMNITFVNVQKGSTIEIDGYVYDRGGTYAGQFKMTFVEDETEDPHFEVEFIN
jgi:hypothetical protein